MARPPTRPEALTRSGRPFIGSNAVAAGLITGPQLRGRSWRRLFHDVYVDAAARVDHRLLIDAALLIAPDGTVICGRSSALVWGSAEIGAVDHVEVLAPRKFGPVKGIDIRIGSPAAGEVTTFRGVPVTSAVH